MELKRPGAALVVCTVLFLAVVPSVSAQSASITDLKVPIHTLRGKTVQVVASVSYDAGTNGKYFYAYVRDRDAHNYAPGNASSSQNTCMKNGGQYSGAAYCRYVPKSKSGTDIITFTMQFNEVKEYSLAAFAGFQDSSFSIIPNSVYNQPFNIAISDKLVLEVDVQFPIVVTIDGAAQTPGPVFIPNVDLGAHTISVPSTQQIDYFTRLRFDHWNDGSTETSRTLNLQDDTTLDALYITQHRLSLDSVQVNATGAGWYDSSSTATFSVPSTHSMNGILGLLGAKWVFKGWYESNNLITSSASSSAAMDRAHSLTAEWTADYAQPIILLGIVATAAIVLAYYSRMRGRSR
jgi:hypothetical protein